MTGNRNRFERSAAALMTAAMLVLAVTGALASPESVFAYESVQDNEKGKTRDQITSNQSMNSNYGNVEQNFGVVLKNQNEGVIGKGYQNSYERTYGNYGQVEYNYGKIYYNGLLESPDYEKPVVKYNYGTVVANDRGGEITLNENSGVIINNGETGGYEGNQIARINKNYGTLHNNISAGVVDFNYGTIINNKQGGSIDTNGEGGKVYNNLGNIRESYGEIGENTSAGTVNFNMGYIGNNKGRVENNKPDRSGKFGNIGTNSGRILFNYRGAVVKVNAASGLIDKNEGTVNGNKGRINNNNGTVEGNEGTVVTNEEGGVVLNLEGGIVETNDGKVYNYGGTVGDNNGTEFFSVSIVHTDNVTVSSTNNDEGLTQAYGQDWIGETDGQTNTVTVLITPARGYEIADITGLDENYVTADRKKDGSWVLTISSGSNMTIEIPEPTEAELWILPYNNTPWFDPSIEPVIDPSDNPGPAPDPDPDPDPEPDPEPEPEPTPDPTPTPDTTPVPDITPTPIPDPNADPVDIMLKHATWNGSIIVLADGTPVSLELLADQDCRGIKSDLLQTADLAWIYESEFLIAIAGGASVSDARNMALDAARTVADYFAKDLPVNYTPEQAAMYKDAYISSFAKTISDGKALKKARNAGRSAGNNAINQELLKQLQEEMTKYDQKPIGI